MPHGGLGERFVCEPVPRGPEALFTFGRGPVVASRRRLAAELTSSLPKLARRSASMGASAVCLHNQNACTNHTVTHSAGPRHPLPGGAETGGNLELAPEMLADGKPPARDPNRAAQGRRPKSSTRCRSLPLPKLVLSPRTGRDLEKRCALCAKPLPLRSETPATACCKDNGHSLSLSGWSAPAETRATQQPRPWRPQPSRPNTDETATTARRNSTRDSPKTHHPSEPEWFLGHLRLDSPTKVGRFAR
jgi:hypothetical protein